MEKHIKGPGDKKKRGKPNADNSIPERDRNEPAAAERTDDQTPTESADAGSPSREEVIANVVDPVTNQDEQAKITNADGHDTPVPDK